MGVGASASAYAMKLSFARCATFFATFYEWSLAPSRAILPGVLCCRWVRP